MTTFGTTEANAREAADRHGLDPDAFLAALDDLARSIGAATGAASKSTEPHAPDDAGSEE